MLSEKRKSEIIEEEKLREKLRFKAKASEKRGQTYGCLGLLIFIVAVIVVVVYARNGKNISKETDSQSTGYSAEQKEKIVNELSPICVKNHKSLFKPKIDELLAASIVPQSQSKGSYSSSECNKIVAGLLDLGYKKNEIQSVSEGKYWIGMDTKQLFFSVGLPSDSNSTTTAFTKNIQLIYGDPLYGATYIYLDNGKVSSFQN